MPRLLLWFIAAAFVATPVVAAPIPDPTGDFLPTYTGTQDPALDIISASAIFDGSNFTFSSTVDGAIGIPGSLYVFGINRGAGTARLASGSPPIGGSVLWDAVAVLFPDGTGRIVTFPVAGPPTITTLPGAVTVSGDTISGIFSAGLLPSTGFTPNDYTFTEWSRLRVNPAADGTNAEIADFAAAGTTVATVPEVSTWATMIVGFGMIGQLLRRRRKFVAARDSAFGAGS
jgi:hypothetical protein